MSDSDQQIINNLHRFVEQEVMPLQKALGDAYENQRHYWQEDGREVPAITAARTKARIASAKAGYYAMFSSPECGGEGLPLKLWFYCWESLFHKYGAPYNQLPYYILSDFTGGPNEIWNYASPSLRAAVLPKLAGGSIHGCFGLSEPDAGSDSWMMKTSAVRDGDHWVLNGTKQWTSWCATAEFVMVFAVTNKELIAQRKGGITVFYVPTDTPGYKLESIIRILGQIGGDEGILSFTDARIPDEYRIGEVDNGFKLAMLGLNHGRLQNVGRVLGTARWAMDKAVEYAKIRKTFGKTLSEHQTIQNYLAECATKLYAGRVMALDCAAKIDAGHAARGELSMLQLFSTRSAFEITDRCIQIHGGMGLANETKLFEALCLARICQITEGSNEMQLRSIAQQLFSGRMDLTFP